ncbi:MAG: RidA family protein [Chlamydiota bacterium]|nr:RidA family protein [Chlamydiota bacterium]
MKIKYSQVQTDKAPAAIGPYSQGVIVAADQNLIFVSGQLPIDPETGEMVRGNIKALTKQVIDNIEAILIASNSGLHHVVKVEVFLKDMNDFAEMNEVYSERFTSHPKPARQAIAVSQLPKNAEIEISCIAVT